MPDIASPCPAGVGAQGWHLLLNDYEADSVMGDEPGAAYRDDVQARQCRMLCLRSNATASFHLEWVFRTAPLRKASLYLQRTDHVLVDLPLEPNYGDAMYTYTGV